MLYLCTLRSTAEHTPALFLTFTQLSVSCESSVRTTVVESGTARSEINSRSRSATSLPVASVSSRSSINRTSAMASLFIRQVHYLVVTIICQSCTVVVFVRIQIIKSCCRAASLLRYYSVTVRDLLWLYELQHHAY